MRRGSVLVEFTFLFPLLVTLFLGVWQFGYSFFLYNQLEQAVRAGARYASLRLYDSGTATPSAAFLATVRNVVVYGDPAGAAEPLVPGLRCEDVILTVTFENEVPAKVAVGVAVYVVPAVFWPIRFQNRPATEFPYLGVYAPPV